MTERERMIAVGSALQLDDADAKRLITGATPLIARVLARDAAERGVAALEELGVHAMAIGERELSRIPRAALARRLIAGSGGGEDASYQVEPLRPRLDPPFVLRTRDIVLMIRGDIRRVESRTTAPDPDPSPSTMMDAEFELAADMATHAWGPSMVPPRAKETRTSVRHLLDIYLRDGKRVRLDTAKFGFDVLGSDRALTDGQNFEILLQRLRLQAPGAIYDSLFDVFRPPLIAWSGRRAGNEITLSTDAAPAFDFYSPWKCVVLARMKRRGHEV